MTAKNTRKRAMCLKKHCMRGKDIYELLLEKGFQISYPSVCKHIASLAKQKEGTKPQEAFIQGYYPRASPVSLTGAKQNSILTISSNAYTWLSLP